MNLLKKRKVDILIITILIIIAGMSWIFYADIYSKKGNEVQIYIDDKLVKTLPLDTDTEYKIQSDHGYNILKISDGKAWIIEASCKNHVCIEHNKISHNNESIVCLPNHLVVQIQNTKSSNKIDDIAR